MGKKIPNYAVFNMNKGRGYTNWYEFRKDSGYNAVREALKQIELEGK